MFDDHDTVTTIHECLQDGQQAKHVVAMQTGGRFIEQQEGVGGIPAQTAEVFDQLETLGLAAGQGVKGLAQSQVTQPHGDQGLETGLNGRMIRKERQGGADAGAEEIRD